MTSNNISQGSNHQSPPRSNLFTRSRMIREEIEKKRSERQPRTMEEILHFLEEALDTMNQQEPLSGEPPEPDITPLKPVLALCNMIENPSPLTQSVTEKKRIIESDWE